MKSRLLLRMVWLMCVGVVRLLAAESAPPASASTAVVAAPAEIKKPDVRKEMAAEIKRQFPFIAKPTEDKEAEATEPAKPEPLVMMNPYRVNENSREVLQEVDRAAQKREAEKFTWKRGGTIYEIGNVSFKFKYNERLNKMDLLNIKF